MSGMFKFVDDLLGITGEDFIFGFCYNIWLFWFLFWLIDSDELSSEEKAASSENSSGEILLLFISFNPKSRLFLIEFLLIFIEERSIIDVDSSILFVWSYSVN